MSIKNYIAIAFIVTILPACIKTTTAIFELSNSTSLNCQITFYSNSSVDSVYSVDANSSILTNHTIIVEGSDNIFFELQEDTISIEFSNGKIIKYYKDRSFQLETKTIYSETYWIKEEISKRNYKYTFPITEEDLNY